MAEEQCNQLRPAGTQLGIDFISQWTDLAGGTLTSKPSCGQWTPPDHSPGESRTAQSSVASRCDCATMASLTTSGFNGLADDGFVSQLIDYRSVPRISINT